MVRDNLSKTLYIFHIQVIFRILINQLFLNIQNTSTQINRNSWNYGLRYCHPSTSNYSFVHVYFCFAFRLITCVVLTQTCPDIMYLFQTNKYSMKPTMALNSSASKVCGNFLVVTTWLNSKSYVEESLCWIKEPFVIDKQHSPPKTHSDNSWIHMQRR